MGPEIGWSAAVLLIVVAAAHIGEETITGFRGFFNKQWFDGSDDCPVTRLRGLVVDKIGLMSLLSALAIAGVLVDQFWIFVALGIISADLVQHLAFSFVVRAYTPGLATCAGYAAYLAFFLGRFEQQILPDPSAWGAIVIGIAFIAINYLGAQRRVRLGRCRPAGA